MLLEAFGWRCLLKIWRFPLRFDAFGGFWMEISIENLEICFPKVSAHFLYKIPYLKVFKNKKIIQAKGVVQQAAF